MQSPNDIQWQCVEFDQLSVTQLYTLLRLRSEVFVVEQDCPYQDMDDNDQAALHLMGSLNGELVSYARLLPPGVKYPQASIGRVITSESVRGTGVGMLLMLQAIANCREAFADAGITISAQHHLDKFYNSLGFEQVSEPYMEDNIPHIEMLLKASAA